MQEIESKFTRQNVSNFSLLRNVLTPQQQQWTAAMLSCNLKKKKNK
jgi:hypothetical protein